MNINEPIFVLKWKELFVNGRVFKVQLNVLPIHGTLYTWYIIRIVVKYQESICYRHFNQCIFGKKNRSIVELSVIGQIDGTCYTWVDAVTFWFWWKTWENAVTFLFCQTLFVWGPNKPWLPGHLEVPSYFLYFWFNELEKPAC